MINLLQIRAFKPRNSALCVVCFSVTESGERIRDISSGPGFHKMRHVMRPWRRDKAPQAQGRNASDASCVNEACIKTGIGAASQQMAPVRTSWGVHANARRRTQKILTHNASNFGVLVPCGKDPCQSNADCSFANTLYPPCMETHRTSTHTRTQYTPYEPTLTIVLRRHGARNASCTSNTTWRVHMEGRILCVTDFNMQWNTYPSMCEHDPTQSRFIPKTHVRIRWEINSNQTPRLPDPATARPPSHSLHSFLHQQKRIKIVSLTSRLFQTYLLNSPMFALRECKV